MQNKKSHLSDLGSAPGCATDLLGESQTDAALALWTGVVAIESSRSLREGAYTASLYWMDLLRSVCNLVRGLYLTGTLCFTLLYLITEN